MILDLLTLWLCKVIYFVLRRVGKHGAALPGLVAEKLRPSLLKKLHSLPDGVIVVSGTNGKTTTTHLTARVLRRAGKRVFTNHSGSNMTRGLLASIVRFSSISGKLPYDVAVLEVDEAYASKLVSSLKPRAAILTNVLRDQLDRFGEIDHTAELLFDLAKGTSEVIIYNACDTRLAKIPSLKLSGRTVSFGFTAALSDHFPSDDEWYGSSKRAVPESAYTLSGLGEVVHGAGKRLHVRTNRLPGWHNQLNLATVFALTSELFGITDPNLFTDLTPPYGRGEELTVRGCTVTLQLVKNPAGFRTAMDVKPEQPALIVINDAIADGRDVSWLWDVDVSQLKARKSIFCSGTRAYDMSVRLKYSDINVVNTNIEVFQCVDNFISLNSEGVVFLTYTAMLHVRSYLSKIQQSSGAAK